MNLDNVAIGDVRGVLGREIQDYEDTCDEHEHTHTHQVVMRSLVDTKITITELPDGGFELYCEPNAGHPDPGTPFTLVCPPQMSFATLLRIVRTL